MITIPAPMQAFEQLHQPFTDQDWLYEIKFDGYRCMAGVEAGEPSNTRLQMATDGMLRVRLLTKAGRDCSAWFPEIGEALAMLPGGPHVIDGEACVLVDGVSDFNLLQSRARKRQPYLGAPLVTFCAFDLLACNGKPTIQLPLTRRKELLRELLKLAGDSSSLLFVGDLPADAALFQSMTLPEPQGLGLKIEGVMAKRKASQYQPGVRSDDWRKVKRPGWREGRSWRS